MILDGVLVKLSINELPVRTKRKKPVLYSEIIRDADAFIVCLDLSKPESESIKSIRKFQIAIFENSTRIAIPIVLCGTKKDLPRFVGREAAEGLAKTFLVDGQCPYIETSAALNENVFYLFLNLFNF